MRGTGLMGGNDPIVEAVEAEGVRTWSTEEMATELLELCTPAARRQAAQEPIVADLTGGLANTKLNLVELARDAVFASAVGAGADAVVVGAAIGICAFVAPALAGLLIASVVLFLVIALGLVLWRPFPRAGRIVAGSGLAALAILSSNAGAGFFV